MSPAAVAAARCCQAPPSFLGAGECQLVTSEGLELAALGRLSGLCDAVRDPGAATHPCVPCALSQLWARGDSGENNIFSGVSFLDDLLQMP